MAGHVKDVRAALEGRGNSKAYTGLLLTRLQRIIDGCHTRSWQELSAAKVQAYLLRLQREEDISAETWNQYLRAIKQFAKWMVQERRGLNTVLIPDDLQAYFTLPGAVVEVHVDYLLPCSEG